MELIIVHYHFRPGGVRRVIEFATPHLLHALRPRVERVVLATGEAPDAAWLRQFKATLAPTPVRCRIEPTLGYTAESHHRPGRLKAFLDELLRSAGAQNDVVWLHNPGVGRNLTMVREFSRACALRGVRLLLHHHDWWFDNRWARWREMQRAGARTLSEAGRIVFTATPNVRHAAINQADASVLQRHFGSQAAWLPNPAWPAPPPAPTRVRHARRWLRDELGDNAPVWLMACRVLRRKNIAEALLLTRWLRPEEWLVTTAATSSSDEQPYARKLLKAARRHGWRLRLGLLHDNESSKPSVAELMAASEAVVLTSLLEGFGLPYLETAAAQRPLIARALPNVAPDLARFGFRFPQLYSDVLVPSRLFDWNAESQRQARLFRHWRDRLPRACRSMLRAPAFSADQPVAFSQLTLDAQLEVLAVPPQESWQFCAPLNSFLRRWRERAEQTALRTTPWPRTANRWLSGPAYARRFIELLDAPTLRPPDASRATAAQQDFLRAKLNVPIHPLLWSKT